MLYNWHGGQWAIYGFFTAIGTHTFFYEGDKISLCGPAFSYRNCSYDENVNVKCKGINEQVVLTVRQPYDVWFEKLNIKI